MKSLTLSLAALLFFSCLSAQTIKPAIGMNFTDFSKNPVGGEYKAKVGYQVGGSVAWGSKWYVEPGIFYVGKSTEFSSSNGSLPDQDQLTISGLRIPVAIGINLLGNGKSTIGVRGFGGVSGFFITSVSDDFEDNVKKNNFGLFAGAGVDFWKLFVDVSYEWSLTNVQKDINTIDVGNSRSLYVTAGLRLGH
jgi:hypothetical protein